MTRVTVPGPVTVRGHQGRAGSLITNGPARSRPAGPGEPGEIASVVLLLASDTDGADARLHES
jgi:hypothetical protein